MTRATLVERALAAHVPEAWLPAPKDPDVQLTRAMRIVASSAYTAENVLKRTWDPTVEPREWSSRWILVSRLAGDTTTSGGTYGVIALVATLYRAADSQPELVLNTDSDALAVAVRGEFDRLVGAQEYQATHVTQWLAGVIRDRLDGIKRVHSWYVPRKSRAMVESIVSSFSEVWGKWSNPPVPVADSAQLSVGVANSLMEEVGEIVGDLNRKRDEALADNRALTERTVESIVLRLTNSRARIERYRYILCENTEPCLDCIRDAMVELDGIIAHTTQDRLAA